MGSPVFGIPTQGNVFFLDPTNGNDGNKGTSPTEAFKTLATAYDSMTANQNDILYYMAGSTALTLPDGTSAPFSWSKNRTHFIGVCAPTQIGQRARIFNTVGTYNDPMISITGDGCHWENIYACNDIADSGALTTVYVTGDYGSMTNCQFVGGANASSAVDANASLYSNGSANYTYRNCTFGAQSIEQGTGANVIKFGATAGGQNYFENCIIHMWSGHLSAALVECLANNSTDRWAMFDRCKFLVWGTTGMDSAFVIPAAGNGTIHLVDCYGFGFTTWDASNRGSVLYGNMGTPTGVDGSGIALALET
jgi:hypothetical protein